MMKNRRTIFLLGTILIVNIILAISFRDFIRESVLIPILYLFWLVRLFLRSLGETCLWPLSLLLLIVVSVFIIRSKNRARSLDQGFREEAGKFEEGRLNFWMKYLHRKSMGIESLSFESYRLRELILSVLAYQENLTNAELEAEYENGRLAIPEPVRDILPQKNRANEPLAVPTSLLNRILNWLRFRPRAEQDNKNSDLLKLIHYLESRMEIKHEDGNQ